MIITLNNAPHQIIACEVAGEIHFANGGYKLMPDKMNQYNVFPLGLQGKDDNGNLYDLFIVWESHDKRDIIVAYKIKE